MFGDNGVFQCSLGSQAEPDEKDTFRRCAECEKLELRIQVMQAETDHRMKALEVRMGSATDYAHPLARNRFSGGGGDGGDQRPSLMSAPKAVSFEAATAQTLVVEDDSKDEDCDAFEMDEESGDAGSRRNLGRKSPRTSERLKRSALAIHGLLLEDNSNLRRSRLGVGSMPLHEQELVESISESISDKIVRSHYNYAIFRLLSTPKRCEIVVRVVSSLAMLFVQYYVLLGATDVTWLFWFNRRVDETNFEDAGYKRRNPNGAGDSPTDWAQLTNRWGEWNSQIGGLPVFTIVPLIFSVLMAAVGCRDQLHEIVVGRLVISATPNRAYVRKTLAYCLQYLRVLVMMQYIDASEMVLGLANGPYNMVLDSLALLFILDFDKVLRLGSKKTVFGEAKAEVRRLHKQEIDTISQRLATPVYGMGTRMRRWTARMEDACLLALACAIFHSAAALQRFSSHGRAIHPDDPEKSDMRQAYKSGLYAATLCIILFKNLSRRAASVEETRPSTLGVVVYSLVELAVCAVAFYVISYVFLSEALTYGDFDKAYLEPEAIISGVLGIGDDDDMVYDDDIFKAGDDY